MSMTDRTPASPVEVLLEDAVAAVRYAADKLPGSGSRMTQAAEYRIREAVDLLDAALQAQDHTTTDGFAGMEFTDGHLWARDIAREYAALEPTHD